MFGRWRFLVVCVVIAMFAALAGDALARQATPTASNAAPVCDVAPRPRSFFASAVGDLLTTPAPASSMPVSTPEPLPKGTPAPPETAAAVRTAMERLLACSNAGGFLLYTALFTDEAARDAVLYLWGPALQPLRAQRIANGEGDLSRREVIDIIAATPENTRKNPDLLMEMDDVQLLPDGRVSAHVTRGLAGQYTANSIVVFQDVDGQWLFASEHILTIDGTPVPGQTP